MGFRVSLDRGRLLELLRRRVWGFMNHGLHAGLHDRFLIFKKLGSGLLGHRSLALDGFLVDCVHSYFKNVLDRLQRFKNNKPEASRLLKDINQRVTYFDHGRP